MLVILLNCVTLGMFHPCEDIDCDSERCKILQVRSFYFEIFHGLNVFSFHSLFDMGNKSTATIKFYLRIQSYHSSEGLSPNQPFVNSTVVSKL